MGKRSAPSCHPTPRGDGAAPSISTSLSAEVAAVNCDLSCGREGGTLYSSVPIPCPGAGRGWHSPCLRRLLILRKRVPSQSRSRRCCRISSRSSGFSLSRNSLGQEPEGEEHGPFSRHSLTQHPSKGPPPAPPRHLPPWLQLPAHSPLTARAPPASPPGAAALSAAA